MLTGAIVKGHHKCGCAQCEALYLAEVEADKMVEELIAEMNARGLDIVDAIYNARSATPVA